VLDHAERVGKKILISGGGRCNFTNVNARAENFLSANPHFAKSALAGFTPADFIALVERHGIQYHEKTLGQLFCDRAAMDIVTMLERECGAVGVRMMLGTQVLSVARAGGTFQVETSNGRIECASLVVATGGLSIPKMGATGLGHDLARQFGLEVRATRPGLVPLVFGPEDAERWCDLTGLSAEVVVSAGGGRRPIRFREKALITHRGLSGPAILQGSSYWRAGEAVELDLAPGQAVVTPLLQPKARRDPAAAVAALRVALPGRFAERWLAVHPPRDWTNAGLAEFECGVHAWRVVPAGSEGYAKAEVTCGGVDTAGLDARTMGAKAVPGLYFVGEVVDVTGWLGGYNFQWAWASGAAAGRRA
jgi:predicted Rossmann fold flavoprotein